MYIMAGMRIAVSHTLSGSLNKKPSTVIHEIIIWYHSGLRRSALSVSMNTSWKFSRYVTYHNDDQNLDTYSYTII